MFARKLLSQFSNAPCTLDDDLSQRVLNNLERVQELGAING